MRSSINAALQVGDHVYVIRHHFETSWRKAWDEPVRFTVDTIEDGQYCVSMDVHGEKCGPLNKWPVEKFDAYLTAHPELLQPHPVTAIR